MKLVIYCGEPGCGKTTFVKNEYFEAYIFSGNKISNYSTYEVIYNTFPELRTATSVTLYKKLKEKLAVKPVIIVDSAERINDKSFELIINTVLSYSDKTVVLTFDVIKNQLFNLSNFRKLTESCDPSSVELINQYVCPDEVINAWIKSNYPDIIYTDYNKILELTNRNFKNINNLMWHKKIVNENATTITQDVVVSYLNNYIEDNFASLPKELLQTLRQSSVIGNIFNKNILEDKRCFNIFEVSKYLKELEEMRIFIKSHIEEQNYYAFISHETYQAIYDSITPNKKKEWLRILLSYYYGILVNLKDTKELLSVLYKIKSIETIFGNDEAIIGINLKLLDLHSKSNDVLKSLSVAEELFYSIDDVELNGLKQYVFLYLIKNYISEGMSKQVIELFNKITCFEFFDGSFLYLDYYKAKCLYNIGKVDESLEIVQSLNEKLKSTSAENIDQPIYSLVYSLTATLENHLNINDGGNHYYSLALNHSFNKLKDKSYYWDILRKCDMFFDYAMSKNYLEKCVGYYSDEETYNDYKLAEVYFNFGTEILFQEGNPNNISERYLVKAEKILREFPNERYAYGKNNLAVYYALFENNIDKALKAFKNALIMGLSDFTYMTIYLNICTCLLLQGKRESKQFESAHKKFCKHVSALKKRQHSTRYEDIYRCILDILILENCGKTKILTATCKRLLDGDYIDDFFKTIINDIYFRNTNHLPVSYNENRFFFGTINKMKTFFAEFRFWE